MTLKHNAEIKLLSSVLKCKKAMMCCIGEINVLDKLCSAMRYSTVDCEFNINKSITHIK